MKKIVCKVVKTAIIVTLCMMFVQVIRFTLESNMSDFDLTKAEGNCREYISDNSVDNYVLIHKKNGITTYPFLAGNRLYIYDIKNDQSRLLANAILPFTEIGNHISIVDNTIYYNSPMWDDVIGNYYYKKIGNHEERDMDLQDLYLGYSIYEDKIYYYKEDYETESYHLYVKDLITGTEELFFDGNVGYFSIFDGKMYCYDLEEKELVIKDLETGDVKKIPYECTEIFSLIPVGEAVYIADGVNFENDAYSDRIMKIDLGTKNIVKKLEIEVQEYGFRLYHRENRLYYNTIPFCIYTYDLLSGTEEVLIDVSEDEPFMREDAYRGNTSLEISYCKDYIAVEMYYYSEEEFNDHAVLLIYDYNGKQISEKELW